MSKMTKSQMIATLSDKTGLSKKDTAGFMDSLAELAYAEVKKGGECIVPGFGKLVKVKRKARDGRNPGRHALRHHREVGPRQPGERQRL